MISKIKIALISLFFLFTACAGSSGIFPIVVLDTTESKVVLPNPISLVVDEAHSQILVANSNVDILFDTASLAVLSFDATDVDAPQLRASKIIESPNFAGEMYFDGVSSVFIPFREASATDINSDIIQKYTLTANNIVEAVSSTVSPDPFGITGDNTYIYVVSNNFLDLFDLNLVKFASIDLTTAEDHNIENSNAESVLSVVVDDVSHLAIVSNEGGRIFIVDLSTKKLIQAVDGPLATRNMALDSDRLLYVVDAATEAVWVFDLKALPAAVTIPESVEDSEFLVTSISVGNDPNGLALDEANHRLYVGNTADDTISVIDTLTYQEIDRISLDLVDLADNFIRDGEEPFGLQVGEFNGTTFLFVACFKSGSVVVINTNTLKVVEVFPNNTL